MDKGFNEHAKIFYLNIKTLKPLVYKGLNVFCNIYSLMVFKGNIIQI